MPIISKYKWGVPETITDARIWRNQLKKEMISEDEYCPQWCQALGVSLPEYAFLSIPPADKFGIKKYKDKTNIVLTLLSLNKPVGFINLNIQNSNDNSLFIKLNDVYLTPEKRTSGISKLITSKIISLIDEYDSNGKYIHVEVMLASQKGAGFYTKLQKELNLKYAKISYNTIVDPSYTI